MKTYAISNPDFTHLTIVNDQLTSLPVAGFLDSSDSTNLFAFGVDLIASKSSAS